LILLENEPCGAPHEQCNARNELRGAQGGSSRGKGELFHT